MNPTTTQPFSPERPPVLKPEHVTPMERKRTIFDASSVLSNTVERIIASQPTTAAQPNTNVVTSVNPVEQAQTTSAQPVVAPTFTVEPSPLHVPENGEWNREHAVAAALAAVQQITGNNPSV
jgi:hypothetical protein